MCESRDFLFNHVIYTNPIRNFFEFHTHDICELIFLKKGNVSGIIGDKIYSLKKNDLIIFRANVPHRISFNDDTEYERYNILLNEKKLANGIFTKLPKRLDVISCDGNNRIIDIFERLDLYCESLDLHDAEIAAKNLIEEILFNLYLTPKDDIDGGKITTHPLISSAMEYINSHYKEPITIDDVAKHLAVTKSHLHHLFMQTMQISPKKYINLKRISKAQHLILMGEKPSEVFVHCGFNDYATFFRNYISILGYSPSEERGIVSSDNIKS
jgi:AraC-like DNA-binding protein